MVLGLIPETRSVSSLRKLPFEACSSEDAQRIPSGAESIRVRNADSEDLAFLPAFIFEISVTTGTY